VRKDTAEAARGIKERFAPPSIVVSLWPIGATLRGWRVPEDVGLVGMHNTPLSAVTVLPLTTVGYDRSAVAYSLITAALSGIGEAVSDRELADAHFALTRSADRSEQQRTENRPTRGRSPPAPRP